MIEDQQGSERPVGGVRPPNTILLGNCCLWYSPHRHQYRSIAHTQNYRHHQCQRIFHQLLRCLLFESSFLSDLSFIGLRLSFNRISALNRLSDTRFLESFRADIFCFRRKQFLTLMIRGAARVPIDKPAVFDRCYTNSTMMNLDTLKVQCFVGL